MTLIGFKTAFFFNDIILSLMESLNIRSMALVAGAKSPAIEPQAQVSKVTSSATRSVA